MLEENKIVDQAQQVMEKLCTIAKTNCEKHFIADQKKKRKMYCRVLFTYNPLLTIQL